MANFYFQQKPNPKKRSVSSLVVCLSGTTAPHGSHLKHGIAICCAAWLTENSKDLGRWAGALSFFCTCFTCNQLLLTPTNWDADKNHQNWENLGITNMALGELNPKAGKTCLLNKNKHMVTHWPSILNNEQLRNHSK